MGYVKLTAKNAGKFITARDENGNAIKKNGDFKDRRDRIALNDHKGKIISRKREEADLRECSINTLHATTIANGLSVLCGLRPVPTTRLNGHFTLTNNILKRNEFITEIAKKSYVRVLTLTEDVMKRVLSKYYKYYNKRGKNPYKDGDVFEIKICHPGYKSPMPIDDVDLSKQNSIDYSILTWDRLSARLRDSIANFCIILSELTEIPRNELRNRCLPDVIRTANANFINLSSDRKDKILNAFTEIRCSWLCKLLKDGKASVNDIRYAKGFELMIPKRIANVIVSDYEIYVPYSEELEQMLKNGCGFATILEGGVLRYSGYAYELPEGATLAA